MRDAIRVFQALGDETRWRILQLVSREALCVCEIAEVLNMPQSSVSSHLQVIRKTGLLDSERCEKWIYYRLSKEYQPMFETMAERFGATAATDAVLAKDARRALKRLARRADTCCPGPKELISIPAP